MMKHFQKIRAALVVISMWISMDSLLALPPNVDATAAVSATVDNTMEWNGNFAAIPLGNITTQASVLTGNAAITLYTNGDVTIDADQTATAKLTDGSDDLFTEYRLTFDGNGTTATGGATVDYTVYSSFLSTPADLTHFAGDGAVLVTLYARASNTAGTLADAGAYTATQTLTAIWG